MSSVKQNLLYKTAELTTECPYFPDIAVTLDQNAYRRRPFKQHLPKFSCTKAATLMITSANLFSTLHATSITPLLFYFVASANRMCT